MIFSYGGTAIGHLKTFLFFDKTKFNDRAFYGKSRCGIFIRQAAFFACRNFIRLMTAKTLLLLPVFSHWRYGDGPFFLHFGR
jgi:hypothetical protein